MSLKDRNHRLQKVTSEIASIRQKLEAQEEKYISDKITEATYEKWHLALSKELNNKSIEMNELSKDDNKSRELFNTTLPYLSDLNYIYNEASVDGKQDFLKGIFWGGFTKENIGGRTELINPMFYANSLNISTLLRVKNVGKPENNMGFPACTSGGT